MKPTLQTTPLDPRYIAARKTLLDALDALSEHQQSLVLAGAQAVYLRTEPHKSTSLVLPLYSSPKPTN